jgi:hypothetical protein
MRSRRECRELIQTIRLAEEMPASISFRAIRSSPIRS